jgi:hypothetical protein
MFVFGARPEAINMVSVEMALKSRPNLSFPQDQSGNAIINVVHGHSSCYSHALKSRLAKLTESSIRTDKLAFVKALSVACSGLVAYV